MPLQEAYPTFTPAQGSAPLLLGDLDRITISQKGYEDDRTLEFAITDDRGEVHIHSGRYATVDGVNVIHDVDELLRPYFHLSESRGLTGGFGLSRNGNFVTLTLRQYSLEVVQFEHTYRVAYTAVPSGLTDTGQAGAMFLTRQPVRRVATDEAAAVSWFNHGEKLLPKVLYLDGDAPRLATLASYPANEADGLMTYRFTLDDLANSLRIPADSILYADIQLLSGSRAADSVRFYPRTDIPPHARHFAFIGAMGEPEFLTFTGSEKTEADFDGCFLMEHNDYRKAATVLHPVRTTCTGYIDEGVRDLVWDMAASPWVYVIEDGRLREATILEVDLGESAPHTEPIGLSVKWRFTAEREQITFARKPEPPHTGVFDPTFDETFE